MVFPDAYSPMKAMTKERDAALLQNEELRTDLMRLMTAIGPYSTTELAIKFATRTRMEWMSYHAGLEKILNIRVQDKQLSDAWREARQIAFDSFGVAPWADSGLTENPKSQEGAK